jgi:hypothetical protein
MKSYGEFSESVEGDELFIFVSNDADIYRQRLQPIYKNAITKMAQGKYDSKKAIKLFMYAVDDAAKKYSKEYSSGDDAKAIFSKKVREYVASRLRDEFEAEAELGNYDDLRPKKYR